MLHPIPDTPAARAAAALPLDPCELVSDDTLRRYAALDPLYIADADKLMLAALSMTLADICAELLARRWAMQKERA